MNAQDWFALTFSGLSIIALVARIVKWYIDTQIKPMVEAIEDIRSETKTNGGSSMRDEIKSIKRQQDLDHELRVSMDSKLDRVYEVLIKHIDKNNG